MKRRCGWQFLSTTASAAIIFLTLTNFSIPFNFASPLGQGSPRCSRLFPSCLTQRSILPGQFRRSKNIRLTRRPYHHLRKSITPVRRSVRWVAKMYGRHAIPGRLSLPVALMPGTSKRETVSNAVSWPSDLRHDRRKGGNLVKPATGAYVNHEVNSNIIPLDFSIFALYANLNVRAMFLLGR